MIKFLSPQPLLRLISQWLRAAALQSLGHWKRKELALKWDPYKQNPFSSFRDTVNQKWTTSHVWSNRRIYYVDALYVLFDNVIKGFEFQNGLAKISEWVSISAKKMPFWLLQNSSMLPKIGRSHGFTRSCQWSRTLLKPAVSAETNFETNGETLRLRFRECGFLLLLRLSYLSAPLELGGRRPESPIATERTPSWDLELRSLRRQFSDYLTTVNSVLCQFFWLNLKYVTDLIV